MANRLPTLARRVSGVGEGREDLSNALDLTRDNPGMQNWVEVSKLFS